MKQTNAERARLARGLSLEEAAKKMRLHPRYLRELELHGSSNFTRMTRMATLYGCSINDLLPSRAATAQQGQEGFSVHSNVHATGGADTHGQSALSAARRSQRYRKPSTPVLVAVE